MYNIHIKQAIFDYEKEKVFDVRWAGYKKYFSSRDEMIDEIDFCDNTILLIAEDSQGNPLGTMRILNQSLSNIELEQFVDINNILLPSELPCAEATRFSIPKHPNSFQIKLLLFKTFYYYCLKNNIITMLISVREELSKDYKFMLFQNVGEGGAYIHPALGNVYHETYKFNVPHAEKLWHKCSHPFYNFIVEMNHPNISLY